MLNRVVISACFLSLFGAAAVTSASAQQPNYGAVQPNEVKWGPLDPKQPNGIQVGVLAGDPAGKGTFVMRVKFPAGSGVASHSHSTTEYGSVLSGKLLVAFGVKPDKATAVTLGPGAFFWLKGGEHHQVWAAEETILDFSAEGPFDLHLD